MATAHQYTHEELNSISHILKSSWRNDLSNIEDPTLSVSILQIIDDNKLICLDTRKIRKVMEMAGFYEPYISTIQNHKRVLSNNEARPKYNAKRRENRNLQEIRCKLMNEKAELCEEINMLKLQILSITDPSGI